MEVKFAKAKWNVSLHDLHRYDTIKWLEYIMLSGRTSSVLVLLRNQVVIQNFNEKN
jgi:hypothetical protein